MKKSSTKRTSVIAIGLAALVGLTSCGSDEKKSSSDQTTNTEQRSADSDVSTPDVSIPDVSTPDVSISDVSIPDVSIPDVTGSIGGLSDDCAAYYQLFAAAFAGDTSGLGDLDDAIAELKTKVPNELDGDVDRVATFYSKLVEVSKKYEDNPSLVFSDPELLKFFGDPEYAQSAERVNTWLTTECANAAG